MKAFLSEIDVQICLDLLINKYKVPDKIMKKVIGQKNYNRLNKFLLSLGKNALDLTELTKMILHEKGVYFFSGSDDGIRELRKYLLRQLDTDELVALYERNPTANKTITSPTYMLTPLSTKKWMMGGVWPRDFVRTLGFPMIFSGISVPKETTTETVIDVEARKTVPPLADFQKDLKEEMLRVLSLEGEHTRCVVTLPTGGGKTRVAVESYIEWMHAGFSQGKYLIWIAQNEELCEQAISCISDMWQEKEYPESLRIYRYFGGNKLTDQQLIGGAVIASIQQLYARANSDDPILEEILRHCGAMIIDEAHHAVAPMYNVLLEKAEDICGPSLFPICGLTATPGRSDGETIKLVDKFQAYLLQPNITGESSYADNPLAYFRKEGYLAKPRHIVYDSGRSFEVDEQQVEADEDRINAALLNELATDEARNYQIIKRLLDIPSGAPTLVYACTVEHAMFLSTTMNAMGRKAATISASTPKVTRRMYIDAFQRGEIEFLFNYGVLTTGFDAPQTSYIVICRPTTSVILYEQIVGRGLRGPKFGGTEYCTIIDFADNLLRLGKPLAYARFSGFWESLSETEAVFPDRLQVLCTN
ncbi:DEAD/DEAH box helicase [Aquibacillus koreensis]|uniref:DEAD/DEAH box helicase n=1 Tax=Aquibacillus koreensis TaxID=279446 RepID=A0A9X3WLK7_9BACI|nr:DEAD/DEAH box helicase [Aquibacillus koreensis]MCT2537678.1 DEAD/DEAH box helicase [Aquibacillus koreensis]MDC3420975.1 DEAD/DEAH box helicase [Aquibacillus koreensis]